MPNTLSISLPEARRLAISSQYLDARPPGDLWTVLQRLRCLQLDPINVVARSHLLVLWSRLGAVDQAALDALLWTERRLFEYWAHAASIVLTEDYPVHHHRMRRYPADASAHSLWLAANDGLRTQILDRLAAEGPLLAEAFDDTSDSPWQSSGWTSGRNVERMLVLLWTQGVLTVAGRRGRTRLWDLAGRCLPQWTGFEPLAEREVVTRSAEHALRALGVARQGQIELHFTRGRYPGLADVLVTLERAGRVKRVRIEGADEPWYVHVDALPELERIREGEWAPRTTLLSPFDNLICDRARTERLWGFVFRTEMYVPKAKRQYGYYLLPILHGDRLIGRLAPRLDRRTGVLAVEGLYAEEGAGAEAGPAVARAISELGEFVGARSVTYPGPVPDAWRKAL